MVDSHCHLDFPDYQSDFAEVIERSQKGLEFVVNVGTDIKSSERVIDLANNYSFIYSAVGIHPHDASTVTPADLDRLATLAKSDKVVAIGECGLDYYRLPSGQESETKAAQAAIFKAQIEIAQERQLPLIVHCRDAYDDLIALFHEYPGSWRGVIHCYLGDLSTAKNFLDLGFFISFTGIITFKNASPDLLAAVKDVPLTSLLIETDAPFLAPMPYRGQRNEPVYVAEVAKKIAEIKNTDLELVVKQTTLNARALFGVS